MPYTPRSTIEQKRAMADALRGNQGQPMLPNAPSGLAYMLNQYMAGKGSREALKAEEANQSLQSSEMQMLMQELQGGSAAPGVLKQGEQYQYQHPDMQRFKLQQAMSANAPKEDYTLGRQGQRYSGRTGEMLNENTNQGSPMVSVNTGQDDYISNRMGAQADAFEKLEASANTAVVANRALDRFMEASPGAEAGGAQPLFNGVKNFLASFGFADEESLTDTAVMEQAIGTILGQYLQELGARGLTDKDMEVLRQSLPRLDTDHGARIEVAGILKASNEAIISDYMSSVESENQRFPEQNFARPPWLEGYAPSPNPAPVAQDDDGWSIQQ